MTKVSYKYKTVFGKNLRMVFFLEIEFDVYRLYHRANPHSSFRSIVRFIVEIQQFVCYHVTPPIIEKLWSQGVATHAYYCFAYA